MDSQLATRIKTVIEHFDLSVSSFADKIGVQRSSISHILSGRNRPSLDFIMKVVRTYPEVNLYWLLLGKGAFPTTQKDDNPPTLNFSKEGESVHTAHQPPIDSSNTEPIRMVVFYSDGTFESFDAKKS
nr:helix-turn-helix transcriptional regulator [Allomuricauda sp.]